MATRTQCANLLEHDAHQHVADMHYHCSGETDCGVSDHEPHMFVKKDVQLRCAGVCRCGSTRLGDHGPGEHK